MTEGNSPSPESDFDARLRRLKEQVREERGDDGPRDGGPRSAGGWAMKLSVELAAGLLVGGGIGWFLDYLLGTKPLMLILFFILGGAAGIWTVYKSSMEQMKQAARDEDRKQK
jgi:ATP synthase protein I